MPTPATVLKKLAITARTDTRTTAAAKNRLRYLYQHHQPASQRPALTAYLINLGLTQLLRCETATTRRRFPENVIEMPSQVPDNAARSAQRIQAASVLAQQQRTMIAAGNYNIQTNFTWYTWPLKSGEKLGDQTRYTLTSYLNIRNKAHATEGKHLSFLSAIRDAMPMSTARVRNVLSEAQIQTIHATTVESAEDAG